MNYNWINSYEIPDITDCRIVLFGAGEGSGEFVSFLETDSRRASILKIVDNDLSIHGQSFYGYEVIHPEQLIDISFDMIIVTSISGRDQIADQLVSLGYVKDKDFYLIGRYPVSFQPAIGLIKKYYLDQFAIDESSACLHIGPGGSFGLEMLLYGYGFQSVFSIDKYRFGSNYPDVTDHLKSLKAIRTYLEKDPSFKKKSLDRFDSLFIWKKHHCLIDEGKIRFLHPMDVCDLSFEENQFDFVFSSGVLEHAKHPESAVSGIMRVLKKGGVALNRVVTRDHRSFAKSFGYHAFSFRTYSKDEWEDISSRKFYQNRLLPVEWSELFVKHGLSIRVFDVEDKMTVDDVMLDQFHSDFHQFSRTDLEEINCVIMGSRS